VQQRQEAIQAARKASRSANVFEDKRIGEYNPEHSQQDKQIARLVRERSQRSKRNQKFRLDNDDDDNEHLLTHKGKTIDKLTAADHVILSDDDEDDDYGGLETDLHFGGGDSKNMASIYGHSVDMAEVYAQRKNDLDDIIMRRKIAKAERLESKHVQEEKIESMDEQYGQLAELLQFRDKEKEIREYIDNKRKGNLTEEDQEFEEWNKEMKTFQFATTKAKASDRTKTPEEISKDTADKLQELETRRLARMKGEFENDSLDDISDEEGTGAKRRKKKKDTKKLSSSLSEKVDYSDSEDEDEQPKPHFTPDGLVLVNKDGLIAKQDKQEDEDNAESSRDNDDDLPELDEGTRVRASYHALEQFDGHEAWYDGVISSVNTDPDTGKILYDITYDDGDLEEGVLPRHVKLPSEVAPEPKKKEPTEDQEELKQKRQKAKARAR
jgi:nucleolar protein 14